jgi:primosomal protein N' (replication factor Y)
VVCLTCGSSAFKNLRIGVDRAREELEALLREPVAEVGVDGDDDPRVRVLVGTEAVLHRVPTAAVVVFLDFDQELLAPRYRAAEEALALLVLGTRLVGGRAEGRGRLVVQTRLPDHEVIQAAQHADPARVSVAEAVRRRELRFPPVTAMAVVSGPAAPELVAALGHPLGVEVMGPTDGRWLLRADVHATLLDALAATPRPSGRVRVEVDPLRV